MPAARIFLQLIADFVVYLGLLIRPRKAIAAENLFLRRQLALYQERKVDPRRIDPATRITLALLSRLFNWRDALVVVQPKTLIRWHRAGFRLLWHWKSKPGRPPIPAELRRLIREMSRDNSLWGEERIANELLVKLGISPHFSRDVRNAHRVPTFVGANRESFRPGKLLPKQLATGELLTSLTCEKFRLESRRARCASTCEGSQASDLAVISAGARFCAITQRPSSPAISVWWSRRGFAFYTSL